MVLGSFTFAPWGCFSHLYFPSSLYKHGRVSRRSLSAFLTVFVSLTTRRP